ncbi:MAG: coproporphyrinogen dehydrogenase HemZ [Sporomusaceae bacterium]|nr:coproporphyrinogen dehydrogenase HemZ [Sporomusaceae bacterium]
MTNKTYVLRGGGQGEELAVAQTAALFGLAAANEAGDWRNKAVVIYHQFLQDGQGTASICELFYHTPDGPRYAARRDYDADCSDLRQRRWLLRLNLYWLLQAVTGGKPNAWGILAGVKPAKLVHRLLDQGCSASSVVQSLQQTFALQPEKARLLTGIALRQRPFLLNSGPERNVSIYIGIPFCPSRCLYCSFPAYAIPAADSVQAFLRALFTDMAAAAATVARYGLAVQSVYIGGGTPTSLQERDLEALLALTAELFAGPATEFTVEAGRPDSLNDVKIELLRAYKVSRVSVNPQTMQQKTLKLIGRMHSVQDIIDTFGKIRACNIAAVNMDVIAGLPGETAADMADSMRQIAALKPDNLTVHTLALKRGSRLSEAAGRYKTPDAAVTAAMLHIAGHTARELGMRPYYLYRQKRMAGNLENVGYALPGTECVYNIQVLAERQTILGIGPAAATKAVRPGGLTAYYHPKDLATYISTLPDRLQKRDALLAAALVT